MLRIVIVNDRYRLVYLAIPRTGSVATQRALLALDGSRSHGKDRHTMRVPAECFGYLVMTTVRNPYARIVSHWAKLRDRRGVGTFRDFLSRVIARELPEKTMNQWLGWNDPGFVMHQESLSGDLAGALYLAEYDSLAGCEIFVRHHLERRNASGIDWRAEYDEETAARVAEWAHLDFARWGYNVDSWRTP